MTVRGMSRHARWRFSRISTMVSPTGTTNGFRRLAQAGQRWHCLWRRPRLRREHQRDEASSFAIERRCCGKGDTIVLRLEEYDTVRTINMAPNAVVDTSPPTLLGRSTGKWEGDTLVVTTSRIAWRYIDPTGVPQSSASRIVERFTPSSDGTRLNLTMTITDPQTFTGPVELKRSWVWRVGETVKPYNCVRDRKR